MGKIALIKMVVLPQCLYVLQGTMYEIPRSVFRELDNHLIDLLWAGKRCQVGPATLHLSWYRGGMKVPDLEMYYLA